MAFISTILNALSNLQHANPMTTLFKRIPKKNLKGISNDVAQQTSKVKPHY
jgi:hypothetical protein